MIPLGSDSTRHSGVLCLLADAFSVTVAGLLISLSVPDAGVEQTVGEVGKQVGDAVECHGNDEAPLHDRIVAGLDGVEDQISEAGAVEDDLDKDRPAQEVPEPDAEDRKSVV